MAEKTETIKIRVSPETRDRWQAWADDPETKETTVAGTIRAAMKDLLQNNNKDGAEDVAALVEQIEQIEADVDLEPVENKLDRVLDQLDALDTRLDDISASHSVSRDGVIQLAEQVYLLLGYVEDPDEDLPRLASAVGIDNPIERAALTGTPKHIAEYLGLEEEAVRDALEILEEDERVDYIDDSGYRRYYRTSEDPEFNGMHGAVE